MIKKNTIYFLISRIKLLFNAFFSRNFILILFLFDIIWKHSKVRPGKFSKEQKKNYKLINQYYEFSRLKVNPRVNILSTNTITNGKLKYNVKTMGPTFFFNKIKKNIPFAYARLPHGFWDDLEKVDCISDDLRLKFFPKIKRIDIAQLIYSIAIPSKGLFIDGFYEELYDLIPKHKNKSNFFISISFKGYSDNNFYGVDILDKNNEYLNFRLNALNKFFTSKDILYDATYPKLLATWGYLNKFQSVCMKHHVVVVGSFYLHDIGKKWNLNHFKHIEIQPRRSQEIRWMILKKIKKYISFISSDNNHHKPIVLFEAGTLSYWLISKLYSWNPNNFYIDMGQSLAIFYPDDQRGSPWLSIHKIVNNH